MTQNIKVKVGNTDVEFYAKPEQGAYYEVGTNGEIGALYIPMNANGTPDIENVGEIEVKWEDA